MKKEEKRRTRVHNRQIRKNKMNAYPIEDIEELAYLIERQGQLDDVLVYEQDLGDGAFYTILGGERRWQAIRYLSEQGRSDGMVNIEVLPAPADEWEEHSLIRTANTYREKDPNVRKLEIEQCENEYAHLCECNQKPKGLKEDWIGLQLGINGRTVRRYLKGQVKAVIEEPKEDGQSKEKEASKKPLTEKDALKLLSSAEKKLEKAMIILEDLSNSDYEDVGRVLNELRNVLFVMES